MPEYAEASCPQLSPCYTVTLSSRKEGTFVGRLPAFGEAFEVTGATLSETRWHLECAIRNRLTTCLLTGNPLPGSDLTDSVVKRLPDSQSWAAGESQLLTDHISVSITTQ